MNWRDEWNAIAARTDGLLAAGNFLIQTLQVNSGDEYGLSNYIAEQARDILKTISVFSAHQGSSIPPSAAKSLVAFIETHGPRINSGGVSRLATLQICLTSLAWFRAEIDYHLADFAAITRRRSERAFLHLQQSIIADRSFQEKWISAYGVGEVACERLGGIHLLLHGIWGFKITATGARTDLFFGEPVDDIESRARAIDAYVLTEWKLVRTPTDHQQKAEIARGQAELYASGALGGLELADYRYIVLVSQDRLPPLPDYNAGTVAYRHVNIAVEPAVPSRAA